MGSRTRWTTERGALWTLDLGGSMPSPVVPRYPVRFGEVQIEHASSLAGAMGLPGAEAAAQRFDGRRRCFAAWADGTGAPEIAAYGWVSRGKEDVGELERTFRLRDGEVYIWNCATLPRYQGQGLYSALLGHMLVQLKSEGVRRAWIGTAVANRPSMRGIENAGFNPVITLVYRRILNLHYMWIAGHAAASAPIVSEARRVIVAEGERSLGPLVLGFG